MPLNVEEKLAREQEFPFRMLEFARTAVLHGWTVQLSKLTGHDVPAWKMIFRDDDHCLHLVYHRTPEKKIAKYGLWRNRYGSRGNCTAEPERIHVAKDGLAQWLRTHRQTCQGGPHLAEMATHHRCHCGGGTNLLAALGILLSPNGEFAAPVEISAEELNARLAAIQADQRIRDTARALHKVVMSSEGENVMPEMLYGPIAAIVEAVRDRDELDGAIPDDGLAGMPEPCQPIGCDNGYHLAGCTYAAVDGVWIDRQIPDLPTSYRPGPYEGASVVDESTEAFPFLELGGQPKDGRQGAELVIPAFYRHGYETVEGHATIDAASVLNVRIPAQPIINTIRHITSASEIRAISIGIDVRPPTPPALCPICCNAVPLGHDGECRQ